MSASKDVSACIVIPPIAGFAMGDWSGTDAALKAGVRLQFSQPWFPTNEASFQPGEVWLGVDGDELVVYTILRDDQPANRATQWNEPTWVTGDAFEFFFQPEGRPGYYEFHVTPENVRLQLFFPSRASFEEGRGHRHWSIAESRFESATQINDARTQWRAVMRVKLALLLDEPRDDGARRFKFSFSRYDYQPGRKRPVTSATTPLTRPEFHNIDEWTWAEIAQS